MRHGAQVDQTRELYERARSVGGALHPFAAIEMTQDDRRRHYGPQWHELMQAKHRYDPDDVFASGPAARVRAACTRLSCYFT